MTRRVNIFQRGFTLVEAVIVIVITAAIAGVVAVFLRAPVQSYVDTAARAELTDVADLALRRMARDLRLALPNSVRVSADRRYLELLLTKTGGRYLREKDNSGTPFLKFETAGACGAPADHCQFKVVGPAPDPAIVVNDWIVVYNLGPGFDPANAYTLGNRAQVTNISGTPPDLIVTLNANPFASQSPAMPSLDGRFQVVTTPVTYFCDANGTLRRYWNYTIQAAQPVNAGAAPLSGASSAVLANGVVDCDFNDANIANVHSALIGLSLTLGVPNSNSGQVSLFHQVHVDNTP